MRIETVEIFVNGRRKVVNYDDPRAALPETGAIPTRSDIAQMKKADVIGWLEAHGVEAPDGKLPDLKAKLVEIMFLEAN